MTIQMKATEQYFPVVLFIMLYKVILTCCDRIGSDTLYVRRRREKGEMISNCSSLIHHIHAFFSLVFVHLLRQ